MSEWLTEWKRTSKWMLHAARLEGMLEAHKVLKGDAADEHDRLLWRMTDEMIAEVNDARDDA